MDKAQKKIRLEQAIDYCIEIRKQLDGFYSLRAKVLLEVMVMELKENLENLNKRTEHQIFKD